MTTTKIINGSELIALCQKQRLSGMRVVGLSHYEVSVKEFEPSLTESPSQIKSDTFPCSGRSSVGGIADVKTPIGTEQVAGDCPVGSELPTVNFAPMPPPKPEPPPKPPKPPKPSHNAPCEACGAPMDGEVCEICDAVERAALAARDKRRNYYAKKHQSTHVRTPHAND